MLATFCLYYACRINSGVRVNMKPPVTILLLALSSQVSAIDRMRDGFPDLPADARQIAERYMGCQHFWGEVNGTGDERDKMVAAQLSELKCDKIEENLERVKLKYHNNQRVLEILEEANFTEGA